MWLPRLLVALIKKRKLKWYGHISKVFWRSKANSIRHSEKEREEEVDRK